MSFERWYCGVIWYDFILDELRGLGSGWQKVHCYEDSCYEYIERCA
jgi:hypothetical protein